MPTKRKTTTPPSPVLAAANFTCQTLTPGAKKENRKQLEDLWVERGALVKLAGKSTWLVATKV